MFDRHLRTLAHVPRWSIIRLIHQQSVAEHSYFVAIYADQIAEFIGWGGDPYTLLLLAIQHDWGEIITGDIAHPTKAACMDKEKMKAFEREGLRKRIDTHLAESREKNMSLSEWAEFKAILTCADLIEGVLFLTSEKIMGNRDGEGIQEIMEEQVFLAISRLPCSEALKEKVSDKYRDAVHEEWTERSGIDKRDTTAEVLHDVRVNE